MNGLTDAPRGIESADVAVRLELPQRYSLEHTLHHLSFEHGDPSLVTRGRGACLALRGPNGALSIAAQQQVDCLRAQIWGADADWMASRCQRMLALLEPYCGHRFRIVRWIWTAQLHAPRRGPRILPDTLGRAATGRAHKTNSHLR